MKPKQEVCVWEEDTLKTGHFLSCGDIFTIRKIDKYTKFCFHCGKKIKEVRK
jgi:hypothetical protein